MAETPEISIVVPAHNEAENLADLVAAVDDAIGEQASIEILLVDDGSTDGTLEVARELARRDSRLRYLSFSRNFGHQAALTAGLRHARGAAMIAMDADFQHPPALLPELIAAWRQGARIVLTERRDSAGTSLLKRLSSAAYYRVLSLLAGVRLRPGSADFYLLDRRVVVALLEFSESRPFLRGLLPGVGFRTQRLEYVAADRRAGRSSYTLARMARLALDGVLSISLTPLRLGTLLAAVLGTLAGLYAVYAVYAALVLRITVPGWASVVLVISVIGAMQLFVLGVIGEYLGQVLVETRRRPPYIIEESNLDDNPAQR